MQGQSDQRGSLSSRLTSLFSSDSPAPKNHPPTYTPSAFKESVSRRHSLDGSSGWDNISDAARTRPTSPTLQSRTAGVAAATSFRPSHPSKSYSISAPPTASFGFARAGPSFARSQTHPAMPVIRWLTGQSAASSDGSIPSRVASSSQSNPPSPSAFAALDDALHDNPFFSRGPSQPQSRPQSRPLDMPSRPQAARLPPAFHSSRPPNYLSSLARTSLPTACVSPLSSASAYQTTYVDPFDDPFAPPPETRNSDLDFLYSPTPIPLAMPPSPPAAHLTRSPPIFTLSPKRSSIDQLRSIQQKGMGIHTTSPPAQLFPNLPNAWKGWFTTDNATDKENMDPFLDDNDTATNAQAQRERIRERCKHSLRPMSSQLMRHFRCCAKASCYLLPRAARVRHSYRWARNRARPCITLARDKGCPGGKRGRGV